VKLIKLGRIAYPQIKELASTYFERSKSIIPLEIVELKQIDFKSIREKQSDNRASQFWVLLDEKGKSLDSPTLAKQIQTWSDNPAIKTIHFVVGAPYGFAEEDKKFANFVWSLMPGTLSSDLAWLILAEQFYRSLTILKKIPYHHE
jgi:23S rRNA (pseudouridine1915-N3)-methyltransferase